VRGREHLIDLLFLEVVGDVLHAQCRKGFLSAITVVILSSICRALAMRQNQCTNRQKINRLRLKSRGEQEAWIRLL
jgi:hypothetical protein